MTGIQNLLYCFYNLANLTGFDNKADLLLRKKHNLFILLHRIFRRTFLDTAAHSVPVEDKQIRLTKTEYAILKQLMINPSQVITKSQILELISFDTPDCTESSLKVHISNLRKKLSDVTDEDLIEAVWGIGFKMK